MKMKCIISHRSNTETGYKDYLAGQTYDIPDGIDIGNYFEAEKPDKKSKKEVVDNG